MLKKNHSLFGYKRRKKNREGVNFVGLIDAGNLWNWQKICRKGADELVFWILTAISRKRKLWFQLVEKTAGRNQYSV